MGPNDGLLTHPSLMVRNSDEAMQLFFLVECGLLHSSPSPLGPLAREEARNLGHGAVMVWQDELSSVCVWSRSEFKDGHDWEQPYLRYGMYLFRHSDESSRLWKFLFTAKRNTLYDSARYWHMLAYYDSWEFAAQLPPLSKFPQYMECITHMPPGYFTPEWALGGLDVPAPLRPVDVQRITTSLTGRVECPHYDERKMDGFEPRSPLARTKINCIIQEADVPLDPSMHAKRNKGIQLENFGNFLPDEQDTLAGPKPHATIQDPAPDQEIMPFADFWRRFFRRLPRADGSARRTKSLAVSESLGFILDRLINASLAADVGDGPEKDQHVLLKALDSFIIYLSARTSASARLWNHLTLFVHDDLEEAGYQTFFYAPSTDDPGCSTDWLAGYGLLFVIPRFTGTSLEPDLQATDKPFIPTFDHVSRRIDALSSTMLRACPARTHVFSLVYVVEESRFCFHRADRSRSAFAIGPVLDKQNVGSEFEMLIDGLHELLSGSLSQYGLHECFMPTNAATGAVARLFSDLSLLSVKVGPRTFQLSRRVDLAPHNGSSEASRYLARLIDGPALPPQADLHTRTGTERADALVSFCWVPAGQDEAHNEAHLLRVGHQRGVEMAAVYDSRYLSDCNGWDLSNAPMRRHPLLLASVMEPLVPLDEVRSVEQFKKAFISIMRAHHSHYEVGILYDRITPRNLMVRANNHEAGVLLGAGGVMDAFHSDGQYACSKSEPEVAWDSLFAPLPVLHLSETEIYSDPVQYHLQLESFLYALVWLVGKDIDTFDRVAQLETSKGKRALASTTKSTAGGLKLRCDTADRAVLMGSWLATLALTFEASFLCRDPLELNRRLGREPREWRGGDITTVWVTYDSFMNVITH